MFLHFITWIKALQKSPDTKAFSSTYFSKLWQAVIRPQHVASVGVQSSCGALKHFALKCKSEMFNCVLPINSHTRRFAVTVSFRRKLLTLRQLYPRAPSRPSVSPCRMGRASTSTLLKSQLVQVVIPPQHDASEEKDPLAGLSSIHSLILDRVWYHAPWLLGYMRRR